MEHLRAPSPATTDRVTLGVGIHNALTALIARNAGFRLLWLGSLEMSSSLGLPDLNILTSAEVAAIIRAVRSATDLPLYVDADGGYGSDTTALRALAEFEPAGASAVCIEDNLFPRRNSLHGTSEGRALEPADSFARWVGKLAAAKDRTLIIARTRGVGGWPQSQRGRPAAAFPAAIDVLAPVAAEVGDEVPVYFDSGVRTPTHLAIALALGARAVLLGRSVLWGLATSGAEGVRAVLAEFVEGLTSVMALVGAAIPIRLRDLTIFDTGSAR